MGACRNNDDELLDQQQQVNLENKYRTASDQSS
jgi:hypothetical protein